MSELEIKFQVPSGARASLRKAIGERHLERVQLEARYFDTADHLLARNEMALRLRREDGAWVQTLKAATPHRLERQEDNVTLEPGAEDPPARPTPELHAASHAGAQLAKLLKTHGDPQLVEVFRTDIVRERRTLHSHLAMVEWALDAGVITAGDSARPVLELELEFKGGDAAGLFAMAHDWQSRHGLWLDPISKAERGSLLLAGCGHAHPVKAGTPCVKRDLGGAALLRAIVASCLSQVLPNAAELAAGSEDPEHVHQLRVGLRRLRTALREIGELAPTLDGDWERPVKAAFDALGEARDLHVLSRSLVPELAHAGAPLADPTAAAHGSEPGEAVLVTRARDAVRGAPFQGALLLLLAFVHAPATPDGGRQAAGGQADADTGTGRVADPGSTDESHPLKHLTDRLDRLHRKITRRAEDYDELAFEEQHRTRKRLKRLRYLAEFAAPLFKARRVEVWLKTLEPAQDALGGHVDQAMAAKRFERLAAEDPRAWYAAGWLRGRLGDSARDARKSLERFARAAVFW